MVRTQPKHQPIPQAPYVERANRAQLKRDREPNLELGRMLLELPAGKFATLSLPDFLHRALVEGRRLTSPIAIRRQLRLIQGFIDDCGAETIREALENPTHAPAPKAPRQEHSLAGELLDGGDTAVFALADRFDAADLQTLRQAVRQARKRLESGATRENVVNDVSRCLTRLHFQG